jgi:hypothetical protein
MAQDLAPRALVPPILFKTAKYFWCLLISVLTLALNVSEIQRKIYSIVRQDTIKVERKGVKCGRPTIFLLLKITLDELFFSIIKHFLPISLSRKLMQVGKK